MTDIDQDAIEQFLDNAQMHQGRKNEWAEGYWIGRAIQHADQNAVDYDWLIAVLEERGLDSAVVAVPKPGDPEPHLN